MRYCLFFGLLMPCLWPSMVLAGAWPRGEGNVFMSYSFRAGLSSGTYESVFIETGITDRLSYGFEIARGDQRCATSSLTWHLADPDAAWQYAVGLGHGRLFGAYSLRTHVNLGRGWQWREQSGWFAADASAALGEEGAASYKMDLTLGRKGPEKMSAFAQLFLSWNEDWQGAHSVEAHITRQVTEVFTLDVGVHRSLKDSDSAGVALSIWANF